MIKITHICTNPPVRITVDGSATDLTIEETRFIIERLIGIVSQYPKEKLNASLLS